MENLSKRDGRAIEELGFYDPITKKVKLNISRIVYRLNTGAQPTDTVRNLLIKSKINNKKKFNKKHGSLHVVFLYM